MNNDIILISSDYCHFTFNCTFYIYFLIVPHVDYNVLYQIYYCAQQHNSELHYRSPATGKQKKQNGQGKKPGNYGYYAIMQITTIKKIRRFLVPLCHEDAEV